MTTDPRAAGEPVTTNDMADAVGPVTIRRTFERNSDRWHELAAVSPTSGSPASSQQTPPPSAVRWHVVGSPREVLDAADQLGLPTAEVRARLTQIRAGAARVTSRVVRVNDHAVYVVVPTASYADEQVSTGSIAMFLTPRCVVTAEAGDDHVTERVIDRLTEPRTLVGRGTLPVLAAMLVELLAGASEVELALGDAVADLETTVFRPDVDPLERLYNLKREISEARRALLPLTIEIPDLGADASATTQEPLRLERRLLDRLTATAERVDRHLDAHDGLLSDMLSVRLSQISVRQNEITLRQNEDMRKISAWAAIAAVPTLLAGIYGMNFDHMPELGWHLGYPIALGIMAGVCLTLHRAFKRAGWL